jgi:hypothetical protein
MTRRIIRKPSPWSASCHEEREREIEHEKKLDEAQSKKDEGKGKEISKPGSSSHRGDRKKPYDKGQKKTPFSDTSKSKEKTSQSGYTITRKKP